METEEELPPKSDTETFVSLLADAGCTLCASSTSTSILILNDLHIVQRRLSAHNHHLLSRFLSGFSSYIQHPVNFRRVLLCRDGSGNGDANGTGGESLVRILLHVPPLQLPLQNILLEKLPECLAAAGDHDLARLVLNHMRWLDFLTDSKAFLDKLLQVIPLCPSSVKKEIIASLPEIIADQSNHEDYDNLISSLEQMLQEDSELLVPVLDAFSNLSLNGDLQEQVVTVALSCMSIADADHLPYLLKFLLLSAAPRSVGRIVSQIREHLNVFEIQGGAALMESRSSALRNSGTAEQRIRSSKKLKRKASEPNIGILILDVLKLSIRFKENLCEDILKEINSVKKVQDHKAIDVWFVVLILTSGGLSAMSARKVVKKKIIDGCLNEALFGQCIRGNKELSQEYFPAYLLVCELLLICKEQNARDFGIFVYATLFEEFDDSYSRREVISSLVMHIGSGISYEIGSALETLVLLTSKYAQELSAFHSHIDGILDYLEGFDEENLQKVYEVFSYLAVTACSSMGTFKSSIANELLMMVRKQIGNPDRKLKKMGIIGIFKIVSLLGDANAAPYLMPTQKTNVEEALELLNTAIDSCKSLPSLMVLFYDELVRMLESANFHPLLMEWVCKHVGDFESSFLLDLVDGQLSSNIDGTCSLEGKLWMNLDGDLSPICLNLLGLLSSPEKSTWLQFLPAKFLLLSVVERLTNNGSLEGIDALLGCPFYLPSPLSFIGATMKDLDISQKKIACLSLYYAINWTRDLVNAFCVQTFTENCGTSHAIKDEITSKLLKRLRNLVFLEALLISCLNALDCKLPEFTCTDNDSSANHICYNAQSTLGELTTKRHRVSNNNSSSTNNSSKAKPDLYGKHRQLTIEESLLKANIAVSQHLRVEKKQLDDEDTLQYASQGQECIEYMGEVKATDGQRQNFRPLYLDSLLHLSCSLFEEPRCSNSWVEFPVHSYLVHDFLLKLNYVSQTCKSTNAVVAPICVAALGIRKMSMTDFFKKISPMFHILKKQLNIVLNELKDGLQRGTCCILDYETCQDYWLKEPRSVTSPGARLVISKHPLALSICKEILCCFRKIIALLDLHSRMNLSIFKNLLEAFQPNNIQDSPKEGTVDQLIYGACSFFEYILDTAMPFCMSLALEVLVSLECVVGSVKMVIRKPEGDNKNFLESVHSILPRVQERLGASAKKLLSHRWDREDADGGSKSRVEMLQKILRIYLSDKSTDGLVYKYACVILPQVPLRRKPNTPDFVDDLPMLSSETLVVWYRVLHEENLEALNRLVKDVLANKLKKNYSEEEVQTTLSKMQSLVNVVVSLVNMCRTHDKVLIHAMAVKYGGAFMDAFLRVFYFLEHNFRAHSEAVIQMLRELQKATRTIQTLCSDAKGSKRTTVTSKIPSTKKSMERFLFNVKALLNSTPSNSMSFWMGNLKHKDLSGQVVASQVYNDNESEENAQESNVQMQEDAGDGSGGEGSQSS